MTMTMTTPYPRFFVARCRAFGGRLGKHRLSVDVRGNVTVWDPVAGHYTTCHGISRATLVSLRRQVARGTIPSVSVEIEP